MEPSAIADFIFLIVLIAMLILTILTVAMDSVRNDYFNELWENFYIKPILDLSLVSKDGTCKDGHDVIPLGEWQGTGAGCDCLGLNWLYVPFASTDRINAGVCTSKERRGGCKNIAEISPKNYTVWKGKNICGSRPQETYVDYLKQTVPKGEKCKDGYKQCGILDSLDQKLCVKQEKACPINKIIIDKKEAPPTDYTYKTLKLNEDNGEYIHFTTEAIDNEAVVKFKISEGKICANPTEANTKVAKEQFVLDINHYGCDDKVANYTYDYRYTTLDQGTKRQLVRDNEIYAGLGVEKGFPQKYSESAKEAKVDLYYRSYLGLNLTCIQEKKLNEKSTNKIMNKTGKANDIHIANCVMISILLALLLIEVFFSCLKMESRGLDCYFYTWFIVFAVFLIIIFSLGLATFTIYNGYNLDYQCGDDLLNNQMHDSQKEINVFEGLDITIVVLSILSLLIYISIIIYIKKNPSRGNEGYQPQNQNDHEEERIPLKNNNNNLSNTPLVNPPPQAIDTPLFNAQPQSDNITFNEKPDYQSGSYQP